MVVILTLNIHNCLSLVRWHCCSLLKVSLKRGLVAPQRKTEWYVIVPGHQNWSRGIRIGNMGQPKILVPYPLLRWHHHCYQKIQKSIFSDQGHLEEHNKRPLGYSPSLFSKLGAFQWYWPCLQEYHQPHHN